MPKEVLTRRIDVNLAGLFDKGVIVPGPNWPKKRGTNPLKCNTWIAVCLQDRKENGSIRLMAEASAYLCGGTLDEAVDLGVNPDCAFDVVGPDTPMPWDKPFCGGPL